jgi:hypothetical protein
MDAINRTAYTHEGEKQAIKLQKENQKAQEKAAMQNFKQRSRENSLMYAPKELENAEGNVYPLTATQRIAQAEIIYKWLIKDL